MRKLYRLEVPLIDSVDAGSVWEKQGENWERINTPMGHTVTPNWWVHEVFEAATKEKNLIFTEVKEVKRFVEV